MKNRETPDGEKRRTENGELGEKISCIKYGKKSPHLE